MHRVANRVTLFMGGDREMMMMIGLCSGTLVFLGQTMLSLGYGAALWFVGSALLRKVAKADPRMREVYMRSMRYVRYYPAHSTPFRDNGETQAKQYKDIP
jgi:type IV secretion system protein VirB3